VAGWAVVAKISQEQHHQMHTKKFIWSNKKVAHIFDSGWDQGTFRPKKTRKMDDGSRGYVVYYGSTGEDGVHSLKLEDYGIIKSWVIIQKLAT
jgi:hypothetical protein